MCGEEEEFTFEWSFEGQTRFYQKENVELENLCTEFVFIGGHKRENLFRAGLVQDMKGRCIAFLLLCDKRPQT